MVCDVNEMRLWILLAWPSAFTRRNAGIPWWALPLDLGTEGLAVCAGHGDGLRKLKLRNVAAIQLW